MKHSKLQQAAAMMVAFTTAQCVLAWYLNLYTGVAFPAGFKGAINLNLTGSGGQSFGVFLAGGINVKLVGEANDYVGKGMAGGEIVIVPPSDAGFVAESASIVGNTCLYGATGMGISAPPNSGGWWLVLMGLLASWWDG